MRSQVQILLPRFLQDIHEIFVNTVVNDGTDIADLMACFMKKEVHNPKFPALSSEVTRLKATEGGARAVCEVIERYVDEALKIEHIEKIKKMISKNYSKGDILELGYTEDEYSEAESQLVQMT